MDNKYPSGKELNEYLRKILNEQGVDAFAKKMDEIMAQQEAEEAAKKDEQSQKKAPQPQSPSMSLPIRDISQTGNTVADDISKVISKAPVDQTSKVPTVRPVTLRDTIKILQPKSVVFAKYALSEWQEDTLTLIMEQLQGYMSRSATLLKPDILGEISIRLNCSEIAQNDKKKALAQIEKLMDYKFEFWWQNNAPQQGMNGRKVETKGHIITTIHNYPNTPYVDVVINKWALPFLLYYGPGIGGNRYLKTTALSLPGKYAKRLYKMLIGYVDKGSFDYRIDAFRKDFIIPDSYTTATIKRSIITPAIDAINECAKGLHVSAEFTVDKTKKQMSKKPAFDTIHFTIEDTSGNRAQNGEGFVSEDVMVRAVYTYLLPLVDKEIEKSLAAYCKTMRMHGDIPLVYSKIKYYDQQLRSGAMTPAKLKNTLFKVIRESAGIDLKPVKHRKIQTEK